jgi:N4-gp56 family major capsid protein
MARTVVGLNDPKAVKRYSGMLAVDIPKESFFGDRMMGEGETSQMPIQRLTELETDAGEQITYDLSVQLKQQPIEGDNRQEGTEEDLQFYTDQVYIDQQRAGVNSGGRMTRKRTLHKLREVARKRQAEWWARLFDEILFIYLSGARGINSGFILPTGWTGRANNALSAPDSAHLMVAGKKTSGPGGTLTTGDKFDLSLIDRFAAMAGTMGGGTQEVPRIQPIKQSGEKRYVCVMHDWQEYDLRTGTSTGQWLDIQKAAATALGKESPIFKGGAGMYNNVVLQKHENVIRFNNFGAGSNVLAARALFLGVQAAVIAFGSPGTGLRFDWYEETRDNGNELVISTNCIWGCKKTVFNGLDYGVVSCDTAAADPNA